MGMMYCVKSYFRTKNFETMVYKFFKKLLLGIFCLIACLNLKGWRANWDNLNEYIHPGNNLH